jgi:hypothetical protein
VRILGIHSITKTIVELPLEKGTGPDDDPEKIFEAHVDAEYLISGFSQAKLDYKIVLESGNLFHLLKRGFSKTWYQLKAGISFKSSRQRGNASINKSLSKHALVAGHFSIPGGGATFGDIEAQEMVCEWLAQAKIKFDVASNLEDGVEGIKIEDVDESKYDIFIFVCGPWYPHHQIPALLLKKFKHCVKIGVNLTVFEEGNAGFDYLLFRDNLDNNQADIAFARSQKLMPVIGIVLTLRQSIYGSRQRHLYVKKIIEEYLQKAEVVPIWFDTTANKNKAGLRSGREFESLICKTDLIITNRLHGLVLSLKNSIPVIAIDAVAGGGKVTAQAQALNWPIIIPAEELDSSVLNEKVLYCLNSDLSGKIRESQKQANFSINQTKTQFMNILENLDL